jgi:hypothetical protein
LHLDLVGQALFSTDFYLLFFKRQEEEKGMAFSFGVAPLVALFADTVSNKPVPEHTLATHH